MEVNRSWPMQNEWTTQRNMDEIYNILWCFCQKFEPHQNKLVFFPSPWRAFSLPQCWYFIMCSFMSVCLCVCTDVCIHFYNTFIVCSQYSIYISYKKNMVLRAPIEHWACCCYCSGKGFLLTFIAYRAFFKSNFAQYKNKNGKTKPNKKEIRFCINRLIGLSLSLSHTPSSIHCSFLSFSILLVHIDYCATFQIRETSEMFAQNAIQNVWHNEEPHRTRPNHARPNEPTNERINEK